MSTAVREHGDSWTQSTLLVHHRNPNNDRDDDPAVQLGPALHETTPPDAEQARDSDQRQRAGQDQGETENPEGETEEQDKMCDSGRPGGRKNLSGGVL